MVGDEAGNGVAEGVTGVGLALLQRVGLEVLVQLVRRLDEGEVGEGVCGQEVEALETVEHVGGLAGSSGEDEVNGDTGNGGVGVSDVE